MTIAKKDFETVAESQPADAGPPSSNMGGNSLPPPTFSGFQVEKPQKVKIDFLSITSSFKIEQIIAHFRHISPYATLEMRQQERGWCGYPFSGLLYYGDEQVGLVAWGAEHGREFFSLSGAGCRYWNDWHCQLLREILLDLKARISRIDLALDFYRGEVRYDDCVAALAAGEFSLKQGGRKPWYQTHESQASWGNAGRTLEVGGKGTSKRIVCYEKGLEVFGKLAKKWEEEPSSVVLDQFRFGQADCAEADTQVKDWMRLEVRYGNQDRDLDLDDYEIVVKRDQYFAGAYPFCARVIERADGLRVPRMVTEKQATVEKMKQAAKDSYGGLIRALRELGYGDAEIVSQLIGMKISKRLEKAGIGNHIAEMRGPASL